MDEMRLLLLRDCAVMRPDGSIDSLLNLPPGTTVARVCNRQVVAARQVLTAWESDTSVDLPDLVIWPNRRALAGSKLAPRLRAISVADIDRRVAEVLPSDEAVSIWKISGSTVVPGASPLRKVDHVIDLGDVLR